MPCLAMDNPGSVELPAVTAPQGNEARNEVLTSVKENLKKVMDKRGNVVLSEILVHRFASAAFQLERGKLTEDKNLYSYLKLISKCGKSKHNNKNRSQKKNDTGQSSLISGAKTAINYSLVHIGSLQCSETWEICSIESNDVLEGVVLDLVPDEQHHLAEKAFIRDPPQAKAILQGLDIHFLLNVLQNGMLQLTLSDEEAQVVQALRICRNYLTHELIVPQLDKLNEVARILQEALSELEQPSGQEEIKKEISTLLKRLDSNNLIEELQAELIHNAPNQQLLERNFTLPSGEGCTLLEVCQKACQLEEVRVEGEVWSGRTSVLLALYQMWAQGVGPLAPHYRLLLPLLQRPGIAACRVPCDNAAPDKLVLHHLHQWAPAVLRNYGEEAVVAAVREVVGCSLALCDSALGYCCGPHWLQGPRVVTDWPKGSSFRSSGEAECPASHTRVVLLPLKSEQVETEVCRWQQQPSTQHVLYKQLRDHQLLCCPQALHVFRGVTSKVVRNLDLEMMRALVEDSHNWTSSSDRAADKEFFFKVAFDNILSNKYDITRVNGHCVPAYLVGPREGPYKFRSPYIEEYCAAMFVSRHPSSASWKWLRQTLRFQRVFTFVLQIWNEEGTLQAHEATIVNYMSVILGLYRLKGKSNAHNNKTWQVDRPSDWTLQKEGFIREGNPKCKLWLFVFHVLESVIGELWAVERVLRHLLRYSVWILDVERFNDSACEDFNRLCRKMVNILLRSKSDGVADVRLPVVKVNDRCRDELLDKRALLLRSLSCFKELSLAVQVKVHQYYNSRDCKYGREPLTELLSKAAHVLHDSPVSIISCTGPLALNFSLEDGAMSSLRELRVTVYSLSCVHALLHSCPPSLAVLCLNVDLASSPASDSVPPPPASKPAVRASCYVRLALRYSGCLKVLAHFSRLPRVSVLRLHGLYPSELPGPATLPTLAARCAALRFVRDCGARLPPHEVRAWCSRLLSCLTAACPGLQRLIVSRAPPPWGLPSMYHQVLQETVQVRRLLVQGSAVSLQEAHQCLLGPCPGAGPCREAAPDGALQPRLGEEERRQLSRRKPAGFELIIIGVPDSAPFALPWEPPIPTGGIEPPPGADLGPLAALARASCQSPHASFCYEACGGALEVLRSPTRDLRLHLLLPRLRDKEVELLQTPGATALHQLLAAAQYTRLKCTHLTALGFLRFVAAVDVIKRRLTAGQRVAPYHVTVLSTQPSCSRWQLEQQRQLLRAELPRLTCLNYALFCVLDAEGHVLLTARKSHKGAVFCCLRV